MSQKPMLDIIMHYAFEEFYEELQMLRMPRHIRTRTAFILSIAVFGLVVYIFYNRKSIDVNFQRKELVQEFKKTGIGNFLLKPHTKPESLENKDKRYSQVKQDEVVFDILQKKKGFFVDIGAHDGQFLSNTLWLERQHDWTGLLIEANPELCQQIDKLKRHAWRLCACLSTTQKSVTFIKGGGVGGVIDHIDDHHIKMLDKKNKITVPCYSLEQVLSVIGVNHIDFYSLDVEGAEMAILQSLRNGLNNGMFTVDVWSIEYRVWDGEKIVVEKSKENLNALRKYFNELGGYFEHSQLSTDDNKRDGYALDVVFVRTKTWCQMYKRFPNGTSCFHTDTTFGIKRYLEPPYPYRAVEDADKRYSQANQDITVFNITQKKGGFFVDIGAHDGQFLSNTLWLERQHNWTGLLIEANPQLCTKIDKVKRHAWKLCACLSDTLQNVSFIMGDAVGGVERYVDEHHIKLLDRKNKVTVPCFSLEAALDEIKSYHIDFFSLDVEGGEKAILESLKKGLVSKRFTVDVWSIEYRVWDGSQIIDEHSMANLKALRKYFKEIGGYSEHSQLFTTNEVKTTEDGKAIDVVFVRNAMFCRNHKKLPNGQECS
uniref:Uncharacterized protein LOC111103075 isoform X1 n=2 Tax=Crassostrea virginica TaxID=6565 RepID=A0A8B8AKS6_CRAVI|nr:uncharacterized protein LOC111103075 isoform X1 [Crassostrea virginica]